jgi:glutamate-1-semialdehyde 2,1-aminomutase
MISGFENSKRLFEKALGLIPGGVNSPVRAFGQVGGTPVYFKSASGARFIDADGNEFVDFCQSWGPLILGHSHPEVVEAVQSAASRGLSYGACHEGEIELAELVLSAFPGFERVRMVSSGTEAVMTALRLARGATGRNLVLKFEGGYHGHFDGMLVKAGSGLVTFGTASSKGIPASIAGTTLVTHLDDEQAVISLFEKYGSDIAAVIIEPVPANNGLLIQRPQFLKFLREITSKNGALLIFDEVITGFRLHFGGFSHLSGVAPDLVTLGKIIGGGLPLGAVIGKAEVLDLLSPLGEVYQAGTLSGNPVSIAAGLSTLGILKHSGVYGKIDALGARFESRLEESNIDFARVRRIGSIVWPYFDTGEFPRRADAISAEAMKRFTQIFHPLLAKGFYLPPSSYEVMFISGAHSEDEIDFLADAICELLSKLD